jgi:ribosome-binding protein aMBF1 (putative translation factor)
MDSYSEKMVEAIEDGRIVKVPEYYAKREGLLIIRKPTEDDAQKTLSQKPDLLSMERIREKKQLKPTFDLTSRPLHWRQDQVVSELIDNFQWVIRQKRRERGLSKKQLSSLIGEPEENIKMIEVGIMPSKDFVLINKLQSFFHINLRKDQKDFSKSTRELLNQDQRPSIFSENKTPRSTPSKPPASQSSSNIAGGDIEVIDY